MERKEPRGPRPIGDAIRSFLKESGLRQPARDERVFRAWGDATGSDWSRRAIPVSYRSGQLTIEVDSSVHLQELKNFRGEGYRTRANQSLGQDLIRKVVFKLKG